VSALTDPRFEGKPKSVKRVAAFSDETHSVATSRDLQLDLSDIISRLGKGLPLPTRYRPSYLSEIERELLSMAGIKTLQLGIGCSRVFLYAVEFPKRVLLLQINGPVSGSLPENAQRNAAPNET